MRLRSLVSATFMVAPFLLLGTPADATEFSARLVGFEEVPAVFSATGKGTLDLKLDKKARTITFTLTYSGLSAPATASHIHFGKRHVAGGITVFFCTNPITPGHQLCPANGGTVTGLIVGGNVLAVQGIPAGDFDALVEIIETHTAYVNVHTTNFPGGEIRGQIRRRNEEDDEH